MQDNEPNFVNRDGIAVYVNDNSKDYAKSLGWVSVEDYADSTQRKAPARRRVRKSAEDND